MTTTMHDNNTAESATIRTLRAMLIGIFLLAITGLSAELILIEHFEDTVQYIPLGLMALSALILGWYAVSRSRVSLRGFQLTMLLFVAAGALGMWLHYNSNAVFEVEIVPEMKGMELFWKAMTGAMPALAPGVMVQLGLLGLAFTYRHPLLVSGNK